MDHQGGRPRGLAGSGEWLAIAASLPAKPVPLAAVAASKQLYTGRCVITGAFLTNSGGATGTITFLDGQDATGVTVGGLSLAAGAMGPLSLPGRGILCEQGVYAVIATATLTGSVFLIPLYKYPHTPPAE